MDERHLVLVAVNADVSEAVRRRHHGDPVLVGLEGLLQVHHSGGGKVTPDESCCTLIRC